MVVNLKAGLLRHRVSILNVTEAADVYGDAVKSETVEKTVWARIEPMSFGQAERLARFGVQVAEDVTHRVVIRWYEGLTGKHRLRFNDRTFEIASIVNTEERGVMWEILCREYVDG